MFSGNTSQVSADQLYVEDVFSTWLYTGTGAAQTITNGIDLAGKGGMVWAKARSSAFGNAVFDTVRGSSSGNARRLITNSTVAATTTNEDWLSFNSNGFTANADPGGGIITTNGTTYASWTFREAPKFFDVVTYTGTGANRTIAHNLGVAPGCILIKRTNTSGDWQVYHRSNANTEYMVLNTTAAKATGTTRWNSTTPTSTEFTVGTDTTVNASGGTYVAYLFAHDTASNGIIQCGSLTTDSSGIATANLGWEPQWIMIKPSSTTGNWVIYDTMRGIPYDGGQALYPNLSNAEVQDGYQQLQSTGFRFNSGSASVATYIYIAIRRGPMKTPTLGTSVLYTDATTASTGAVTTTNFPVDLQIGKWRTGSDAGQDWSFIDRLRGLNTIGAETYVPSLRSTNTNAEATSLLGFNFDNLSYKLGSYYNGLSKVFYNLRRAPGFFDEVCYTGTGVARTVNHNLGVAPELIIVKSRSAASGWVTYAAPLGIGNFLTLQSNTASTADPGNVIWNNVSPTSTTFSVGTNAAVNGSGSTYVAYLFASAPGVSKVGSYTGNGSSQTINCGFAAGARFVMIKRTDSTGNWLVADSARGIVAGNDPLLYLNSTAAEVTTLDWIDADASGFIVNQDATANANVNGATYIYLAIS